MMNEKHHYEVSITRRKRQRVAIGRSIVRDPTAFLFDEPLSNLDAKLRVQMRTEIKELHQRLSTTTVYVTHDQIEAMTMADKIVLMQGGRIEQVGTPDELFDRPATIYAADFIGTPTTNFLHGTVGDGAVHAADGLSIPLPDGLAARAGAEVTCGLRPSDLSLTETGPIRGTVMLAEKTGVEQNVHLSVAGGDFVVTAPRDIHVSPGDVACADIPPGRVHVFDRATGARL